MASIIIATPNEAMYAQAAEVVAAAALDAKALRVSSQTVLAAVAAERAQGAVVAVARGNHAHLIKTMTDMPLIEIVLSGQELALLMEQAVAASGKESPAIALVGFRGMFSDPQPFARMLGAKVVVYDAASAEDIAATVEAAKAEGADVIIGGEIALRHAARTGVKGVPLGSSKISLETAIRMAERVRYGILLERQKTAEFMSLLDYSFDVIMKLDRDGRVTVANYRAEKAFGRRAQALCGMDIAELMELSPEGPLAMALQAGKSAYSLVVRTKHDAYVANLAAIVVAGEARGFILSMQEFGDIDALEARVRSDRYAGGHMAKATFAQLKARAPRMRMALEDAAQYAQYDLPVLLAGAFGTDKLSLAESMHNASRRRKNPFVSIDLSGYSPQMQQTCFFGAQAGENVFSKAHRGTLFIDHVQRLTPEAQLQLLTVLGEGFLQRVDGGPLLPVHVRVICGADEALLEAARAGGFSEALYRALTRFVVRIPALQERREDMADLIADHLLRYTGQYRKYVTLTPQAQALLHGFPWTGDTAQLSSFLEKLVVLAPDKEIGPDFVRRHLPPLDEAAGDAQAPLPAPVYASPEEARIREALMAQGGSRLETAAALGISKATLWRKMKKYGIAATFAKEE